MAIYYDPQEVKQRQEREKAANQIQHKSIENVYIAAVKRAIQAYHKRVSELNKIIDDNLERYSDSVAEEENGRIRELKNAAYNETRQSVYDIYSRVRSLLSRAAYADRDSFVQKDVDYIKSIPLTASELQNMADGYQRTGNFTMLRWLRGYISQFDGKDKPNPYNVVNIKMPEDILKTYKTYFDSALALVEKVKEEKYNTDNPSEIAAYADANFGTLASVIGSGSDLESFSRKSVPEADMHVFDAVKLKDPTVNAYIA